MMMTIHCPQRKASCFFLLGECDSDWIRYNPCGRVQSGLYKIGNESVPFLDCTQISIPCVSHRDRRGKHLHNGSMNVMTDPSVHHLYASANGSFEEIRSGNRDQSWNQQEAGYNEKSERIMTENESCPPKPYEDESLRNKVKSMSSGLPIALMENDPRLTSICHRDATHTIARGLDVQPNSGLNTSEKDITTAKTNSFGDDQTMEMYMYEKYGFHRLLPRASCDSGTEHTSKNQVIVEDWTTSRRVVINGNGNVGISSSGKIYFYDYEPRIFAAFEFGTLLFTVMKSVLISFSRPVAEWFKDVEQTLEREESSGVREPLPSFDAKTPLASSCFLAVKEVVVRTVKELIQLCAIALLPARRVAKLLKDVRKSSVRKAARGVRMRGARVTRTALRANLITITSSAIVSQVIILGQYHLQIQNIANVKEEPSVPSMDKSDTKSNDEKVKERIILLRRSSFFNVTGHAAAIFGGAVGAGIGSELHLKVGAWLGLAIGEMIGRSLAERWEKSVPDKWFLYGL